VALFSGTDPASTGSAMYAADRPLAALSLSLNKVDSSAWTKPMSQYKPNQQDVITSGGWIALLFLILCFIQLTRSLHRFLISFWFGHKSKWQLWNEVLHCLYRWICECNGYFNSEDSPLSQPSLDALRHNSGVFPSHWQDDDDLDVNDDGEDSDDNEESGHFFGLGDPEESIRGWWEGPADGFRRLAQDEEPMSSYPVQHHKNRAVKIHQDPNDIEMTIFGQPNAQQEEKQQMRQQAERSQQSLLLPRQSSKLASSQQMIPSHALSAETVNAREGSQRNWTLQDMEISM
jgi:hypothetical protein